MSSETEQTPSSRDGTIVVAIVIPSVIVIVLLILIIAWVFRFLCDLWMPVLTPAQPSIRLAMRRIRSRRLRHHQARANEATLERYRWERQGSGIFGVGYKTEGTAYEVGYIDRLVGTSVVPTATDVLLLGLR